MLNTSELCPQEDFSAAENFLLAGLIFSALTNGSKWSAVATEHFVSDTTGYFLKIVSVIKL